MQPVALPLLCLLLVPAPPIRKCKYIHGSVENAPPLTAAERSRRYSSSGRLKAVLEYAAWPRATRLLH